MSPEWHPAFEEYCETIFELREDDVDVIQARVAERLEISRPAVSEMIKRMEGEGLVQLSHGRSVRPCFESISLACGSLEADVRRKAWLHCRTPPVESFG